MSALRSAEITARESFRLAHLGNLPPVFVQVKPAGSHPQTFASSAFVFLLLKYFLSYGFRRVVLSRTPTAVAWGGETLFVIRTSRMSWRNTRAHVREVWNKVDMMSVGLCALGGGGGVSSRI